jgi:endonuclease G
MSLTRFLLAIGWAIIVAATAARTAVADTACPEHFVGGREPTLINVRLSSQTLQLCFLAYGVLHSGLTRTPLWSAEHLTAYALGGAHQTRRRNVFHPELLIEANQRAEISDYVRSGYDRGHMTPSGDMPDAEAQGQSFSLANVVPQAPKLNRGLWEGVEATVRTLAQKEGELYVVTGPVFAGIELQALQGRVLIPTSIWKAVYDPRIGAAGVYIVANTDIAEAQSISVSQLRDLTGVDPFPSLSEAIKRRPMDLPPPTPYRGRRHHS